MSRGHLPSGRTRLRGHSDQASASHVAPSNVPSLKAHLPVRRANSCRTPRGHEAQFATNHLGHFRLTLGLWPALAAAEGARVVSVSSRGHQISGIDFEDIDFRVRRYDKWVAYGQSKTANALSNEKQTYGHA